MFLKIMHYLEIIMRRNVRKHVVECVENNELIRNFLTLVSNLREIFHISLVIVILLYLLNRCCGVKYVITTELFTILGKIYSRSNITATIRRLKEKGILESRRTIVVFEDGFVRTAKVVYLREDVEKKIGNFITNVLKSISYVKFC